MGCLGASSSIFNMVLDSSKKKEKKWKESVKIAQGLWCNPGLQNCDVLSYTPQESLLSFIFLLSNTDSSAALACHRETEGVTGKQTSLRKQSTTFAPPGILEASFWQAALNS